MWREGRCSAKPNRTGNTNTRTLAKCYVWRSRYGERAGALANPEHQHQTLRVRTLDEAAAARWLLAANSKLSPPRREQSVSCLLPRISPVHNGFACFTFSTSKTRLRASTSDHSSITFRDTAPQRCNRSSLQGHDLKLPLERPCHCQRQSTRHRCNRLLPLPPVLPSRRGTCLLAGLAHRPVTLSLPSLPQHRPAPAAHLLRLKRLISAPTFGRKSLPTWIAFSTPNLLSGTPYAQHKGGARQPFAGNAGQQSRANWPI